MLFNEKDPEKEKMEKFAASCKPLEELLDSVRDIEGFPIGKDEDILALSDAPWYTACPNPYINDFVEAFGKPYDEDTDTYERTPFVSDVSEGKNDPIYNAHSYHTKVPHKAIIPFIKHYTEEGDIIFDGFCGTGMTGVATRLSKRHSILCDLSPAASFIACNYNIPSDIKKFESASKKFIKEIYDEVGWMYETLHTDGHTKGIINYVVWSDVLICPYCENDYIFWEVAVDKEKDKVNKEYSCPHCNSMIKKSDCERSKITYFDSLINQEITQIKQVPVLINYSVNKQRHEKTPEKADLDLIDKINNNSIPYWHPTNRMPEGDESRRNDKYGLTYVHHFYTQRNLHVLSAIYNLIRNNKSKSTLNIVFQSISATLSSKFVRYNMGHRGNGNLSGTLYVPSLIAENNVIKLFEGKIKDFLKALNFTCRANFISCQSNSNLPQLKNNSVDYIFTDPPFGDNLMYSELNFLWESWLKVFTNNSSEAIMSSSQGKGLDEYKELMTATFKEMYRILKPNRWITVEFHNSKPSVWNAIQDGLTKAGFIVAQVSVLDKKQGSFKQVTAAGSVKNDLVINAYKPRRRFEEMFLKRAGDNLECDFIQEHLGHLPVEPNIERTEQMLYSKVLAYYVQHGYEIRLNAKQFYKLLTEHFKLIDGYWFLDNQINEYEEWKKDHGLKAIEEIFKKQLTLFVNDEKSSIIWLYNFLEIPKNYSEILTAYNQVITNIDDEIPELKEILDANFIYENKIYRRPLTDKERVEKEEKNEKELLKAFDKILLQARSSSKKIKSIRKEAIKLGFTKAYQEKRFGDILAVAGKLDKDLLENNSEINDFVEIARMKAGEL
jgi:DNA modification methylase